MIFILPETVFLLIMGDLSFQGNIKGLRSLVEPLQVAMDNGAKRALIPLENKRNFLDVTGDNMEHADRIFFADQRLRPSRRWGSRSD
jgi:ATP-dependent Lon protease